MGEATRPLKSLGNSPHSAPPNPPSKGHFTANSAVRLGNFVGGCRFGSPAKMPICPSQTEIEGRLRKQSSPQNQG
jgi:hypothetical protein